MGLESLSVNRNLGGGGGFETRSRAYAARGEFTRLELGARIAASVGMAGAGRLSQGPRGRPPRPGFPAQVRKMETSGRPPTEHRRQLRSRAG